MAMNDELRISLGVPAIAANRFYVAVTPSTVRLAFGEMVEGEIFYHTAAMLSREDGIALRDLLNSLFPPAEKPN